MGNRYGNDIAGSVQSGNREIPGYGKNDYGDSGYLKKNISNLPDILNQQNETDISELSFSKYEKDLVSIDFDIFKLKKNYADALCRQISLTGEKYGNPKISTVFIGGGTPTVLRPYDISKITDTVYRFFDVPKDIEFTIEANPETVDLESLSEYREMGINRISLGMQSACDTELKNISRIHTFKSVQEAVINARKAGFDNLNLDIMYALPGQTAESFKVTLDKVISLSPEHISVYGLQLEEGTPLFNNRKKFIFPDEDEENALNALAISVLSENGYRRYEISNYSKPGFECKHNLNYWTLGEYFGFGPASHSFIDGKRYSIKKDIFDFCSSTDFFNVIKTEEELTDEGKTEEYIMLSLRLCRGLSADILRSMTGNAEEYLKRAEPYIKEGFMEMKDGYLRFTPKGFNVSNTVLSKIIYG